MRAARDHVVLEVQDPARSIYFRDPDGVTLEARRYPVGK